MHALCVVVLDILPQQAPQVVLTQHHHVIEKPPANGSDEALEASGRRHFSAAFRISYGLAQRDSTKLIFELNLLISADFESLEAIDHGSNRIWAVVQRTVIERRTREMGSAFSCGGYVYKN